MDGTVARPDVVWSRRACAAVHSSYTPDGLYAGPYWTMARFSCRLVTAGRVYAPHMHGPRRSLGYFRPFAPPIRAAAWAGNDRGRAPCDPTSKAVWLAAAGSPILLQVRGGVFGATTTPLGRRYGSILRIFMPESGRATDCTKANIRPFIPWDVCQQPGGGKPFLVRCSFPAILARQLAASNQTAPFRQPGPTVLQSHLKTVRPQIPFHRNRLAHSTQFRRRH